MAEQNGAVRVIEDDRLLARPFLKVITNNVSESGLIGIALDPHFATNHYVYVQYTTSPHDDVPLHNRVSRFTAAGNVVQPGSERVLIDLDAHTASHHMGGALQFGIDGKLYISTGDGHGKERAQLLTSTYGKILRINPDGSIPADNPFVNRTSGKYRAIWAIGLRNPFKIAVQPGTGRIFANDVGQTEWEEINDVVAGPTMVGRARRDLPMNRA